MTFDEFMTNTLGKAIDFDKTAGVQCVDLVDLYFQDVIQMPIVWVRNAKDFYNDFNNYQPLKDNFDRIEKHQGSCQHKARRCDLGWRISRTLCNSNWRRRHR